MYSELNMSTCFTLCLLIDSNIWMIKDIPVLTFLIYKFTSFLVFHAYIYFYRENVENGLHVNMWTKSLLGHDNVWAACHILVILITLDNITVDLFSLCTKIHVLVR